jgi:RAD51-like protein 2
MASAVISDLKMNNSTQSILSPEYFLKGIHYFRIHDYVEQLALINLLPTLLGQYDGRVRIIILDSIAFHFRHDFNGDLALRSRLLTMTAQSLLDVAERFDVAVVLFNHMTTRLNNNNNNNNNTVQNKNNNNINNNNKLMNNEVDEHHQPLLSFQPSLIPALGDGWGHNCTHRILLYWKEQLRCAHMLKSPSCKSSTVIFQVNHRGIR